METPWDRIITRSKTSSLCRKVIELDNKTGQRERALIAGILAACDLLDADLNQHIAEIIKS